MGIFLLVAIGLIVLVLLWIFMAATLAEAERRLCRPLTFWETVLLAVAFKFAVIYVWLLMPDKSKTRP